MWQSLPRFQNIGANSIMAGQNPAILILAASIRPGQSWDLRLPYASLRVTLRVGTQKQPTFMHLLTGLRLQHPPRALDLLIRAGQSKKVLVCPHEYADSFKPPTPRVHRFRRGPD